MRRYSQVFATIQLRVRRSSDTIRPHGTAAFCRRETTSFRGLYRNVAGDPTNVIDVGEVPRSIRTRSEVSFAAMSLRPSNAARQREGNQYVLSRQTTTA